MTPLPLHGLGSRQDLPLPFEYVVAGAATALVISFLVLAVAWRVPRYRDDGGVALPRLTALVDRATPVLRSLVLASFAWMALALWFGQDRVTNPIFGFVFVWLWVGLVPVSLLTGASYRTLNPLRTLLSLLPGRPDHPVVARLGLWPAAAAVVAFAWLELIQPDNNSLPVLRLWTLAWLAWTLLPALILGRGWIAAADPFEAFATLVAGLSPWRRRHGIVHLLNPIGNVATALRPAGSGALATMLLAATAFDSFGNTSGWIAAVQTSPWTPELLRTAGLIGMALLVGGSYLAASAALRGPGRGTVATADAMAAGLVPIVVGYQVAHYLSLLVVEGQRTAILASDPLGLGWNVFGTAELGVNTALFDHPEVTAIVQLAAIVTGHLLGVIVAHERALSVARSPRPVLSQVPTLLLMVLYTVAGLVLLFSP